MAKVTYSNEKQKERAILVSISVANEFNPEESLVELTALVDAANIEALTQIFQRTNEPSVQYLIGTGKLDELKKLTDEYKPDLIIFDNELSGMRLRNLEEFLSCKVIDRSMLILDIFASRAVSAEGKLQVELTQLKYMLPRLKGIIASNNKYGSRTGLRGSGETKLELDKRRITDQVEKLALKLKELEKHREITTSKRKENKIKTIAIVGYTNSGKSTLLNTLTKSNVLSKDMLFATLDTTSRNMWFGENKQAVLTDTVGFVSRLPHAFIDAFKSTLKETIDADLLYIVVDASSKRAEREVEIVFEVLKELKVITKKYILVLNKVDKQNLLKDKFDSANTVEISALKNIGIDKLKEKTIEMLF